ncbi:class I SAM-dependent methyltransferase [Candidatus Contubernalis alkaliaceticus]|uniref:class I SAM-dependent methyltransferase n=1 Tax=Candidatus Contubernalis alkaliaceticus TaxID=338645 RepID=UPI001F4C3EBC|nr:class I SAM-dependent methyltransferase [Candidatus Contubernalis alkalaceticus]
MQFLKTLDFAHLIVGRFVKAGDMVIDATAGNGQDSVFLAKLVGEEGRVIAFDIQEKAITATKEYLLQEGLLSRVHLVQDGHENMQNYIKTCVSAVMFNLGYLPGSDQSIITRSDTTLQGVKAALSLLFSGGVLTVVVYTGHPGGQEEWDGLESYLKKLDKKNFRVFLCKYLNLKKSPFLVVVEKF